MQAFFHKSGNVQDLRGKLKINFKDSQCITAQPLTKKLETLLRLHE